MAKDRKMHIKCVCGRWMRRDLQAEHGEQRRTADPWPLHSDALGVHPSQIPEAVKQARSLGVPTEFDSSGRAILRDRKHRKDLCQALGYFDRNAGYGDASPRNF